jgi:hypothetical protein
MVLVTREDANNYLDSKVSPLWIAAIALGGAVWFEKKYGGSYIDYSRSVDILDRYEYD